MQCVVVLQIRKQHKIGIVSRAASIYTTLTTMNVIEKEIVTSYVLESNLMRHIMIQFIKYTM